MLAASASAGESRVGSRCAAGLAILWLGAAVQRPCRARDAVHKQAVPEGAEHGTEEPTAAEDQRHRQHHRRAGERRSERELPWIVPGPDEGTTAPPPQDGAGRG